jgi:hypothetical protein
LPSKSILRALYLQSVLEQLVHLRHLARDGQVNGAVANLDNEATLDLGVDLGNNLELLALGNVAGLVDGGLEAGKGSAVEGLVQVSHVFSFSSFLCPWKSSPVKRFRVTYLSAGDCHLNLPSVRTHEQTELLYNAL